MGWGNWGQGPDWGKTGWGLEKPMLAIRHIQVRDQGKLGQGLIGDTQVDDWGLMDTWVGFWRELWFWLEIGEQVWG